MDHPLPSGPGVPPMSSRQQPQRPSNQVSQGQSSSHPSAMPQNLYPVPHQDVPGSQSIPTAPPTAFNVPLPPYSSSPPPFSHRTNYANTQYVLSHSHPSSRMAYPSPPFAFPHHPGVPGRELSAPHLAYSSPSMMSMLHQHQPVYAYQGSSTDPTPPPHQSYMSGTTATASPVFPRSPISPPPSLHSSLTPPPTSTATGDLPRPASYPSSGGYSPVGYTTPPPFVYPPPFVPPIPLYASRYPAPHYTQSYSAPHRSGDQGARWYFPPDATSQSQSNLDHRSVASRHEDEQPGQTRIVTPPHNPSPTGKSPPQSHFGGPNNLRTEIAPTSLTPSSSTSQTKIAEIPPASETRRDWPQERRSYHPKTPSQRSEWVMWAGNVPSDVTPDELRDFFNQSLPPPSPSLSEPSMNLQQVYGGVLSVFLIARSNCAFINFESEVQLGAATARFHGQPIRPDDSRCPRLVCRVRNRTDDLRAGVGAQRGSAMHIRWIKEQRERTRAVSKGGISLGLADAIQKSSSPFSLSDDEERSTTSCSNRSDSCGSTNSSVLARYFPQRYFILKSRTQSDLDLSVERSAWATQQHNEEILDQAYRTSKDVFIVFGANKSGEFYGYARMAGPILQSEDRVHWASRSTSPASLGRSRNVTGKTPISPPPETEQGYDPHYIFPREEHRVVEQSPRPVPDAREGTGASSVKTHASSAPAELRGSRHRPVQGAATSPPPASVSLKSLSFELNADAPYRAMRETLEQGSRQVAQSTITAPSRAREDISEGALDAGLPAVAEEPTKMNIVPDDTLEDIGTRPFRVDWIRTERLPFFRTRHLRNPWNHGREVKVSRDGTELEPSIGQQLLEEWDKPSPSPTHVPAPIPHTGARRGPKSMHT